MLCSTLPVFTLPVSTLPVSTLTVSTLAVLTMPVSTLSFPTLSISTLPISTLPVFALPVSALPISALPVSALHVSTLPVSTCLYCTCLYSSRDGQRRDRQSRDMQSRDRQSRDRQCRDRQSRDRQRYNRQKACWCLLTVFIEYSKHYIHQMVCQLYFSYCFSYVFQCGLINSSPRYVIECQSCVYLIDAFQHLSKVIVLLKGYTLYNKSDQPMKSAVLVMQCHNSTQHYSSKTTRILRAIMLSVVVIQL